MREASKKTTEEGKDLPQAALAMEDGPDGCAEGQGFMVVRFRARSGKDSIPDSACPLGVHNLQASVFHGLGLSFFPQKELSDRALEGFERAPNPLYAHIPTLHICNVASWDQDSCSGSEGLVDKSVSVSSCM